MILPRSIKRIPTYRYQPETLTNGFSLSDISSGNVSERSLQHLDKFIRDCKEAGIWSKFYLLMPFIGNNLSTAIREIISAAATNAINFVSGDWSEANGLTGNGSTKYIDTGFSATALLATGHLAFYQRADNVSTGVRVHIGASSATQQFWLGSANPSANVAARYGGTTSAVDSNPMVRGFYYAERQSPTDLKIYRNNNQIATLATSITATAPALNLLGWGENNNGAPASYDNSTGCFLSAGAALTAQQRSDFYAIVQTFQTNLGRAV